MYVNVCSKNSLKRKGVKKWQTYRELVAKLGEEVADAIVETKKQIDDENRANPNAPKCEAARQYWVLDEEAEEDVREDWVSRLLTISDDPLPEPSKPAKLHIAVRRRSSKAKAGGGFRKEVDLQGVLGGSPKHLKSIRVLGTIGIKIPYNPIKPNPESPKPTETGKKT